ncbi:MAG: hypothetical protein Q7J16_01745 [Candidatus Cloacimonadales bacterium]|nr:hypothetical protein [Candidatus Cloacimonadales bacterium]
MYPDICKWLESYLNCKFVKDSKKITVLDTHASYLSNFIIKLKYQKYFPEFSTYQIQQDITGFIEYNDKVELVFVECKLDQLTLSNLSQLIGYSFIAKPFISILLSPKGMSNSLERLLNVFNRRDILQYRPKRKILIIKWDIHKQDIDYMSSII